LQRNLDTVLSVDVDSGVSQWRLNSHPSSDVSFTPASTSFTGQHVDGDELWVFDNCSDVNAPPRAVAYNLDCTDWCCP